MSAKVYTGDVIYDELGDEYMMTIPMELLQELNWDMYTELEWIVEDGKVILRRKLEHTEQE